MRRDPRARAAITDALADALGDLAGLCCILALGWLCLAVADQVDDAIGMALHGEEVR